MTIQPKKAHQFPFSIRAIGLMSGSSLDGLDICLSEFNHSNNSWNFIIHKAATIPYTDSLESKLNEAMYISGQKLVQLDVELGKWIGENVNAFLSDLSFAVDIIGSHGHTVFHEPHRGYSTQIGSGAHIAAITGIPCICNFRMGDVARGGQGAPLVPIGDKLLFGEYDYCLNLGGFSNISYQDDSKRLAFDVCPTNTALNQLARELGENYDNKGLLGRKGKINSNLLNELNSFDYYGYAGAKSLGKEWLNSVFMPVIIKHEIPVIDKLRTVYEHISTQISLVLSNNSTHKMLVTGGGAKNEFLIELIKAKTKTQLVLPSSEIIDYKEALIFSFLAVLYKQKIPSCLASATGAKTDSIGGCMFL